MDFTLTLPVTSIIYKSYDGLSIIPRLAKEINDSNSKELCQRFTLEDMHKELIEESVHNTQLSHDEIPKVETIHNWVSRYSAEMKRDVADKMLANYNK
nr:6250_t:CDS:2 [Entrophospora candida]